MTQKRADLGFGEELDQFDPQAWQPKPKPAARPKVESLASRQAAEAVGFQSREPQRQPVESDVKPRRRRTGRNAQINIKTTPETIEQFTQLADDNGWGLGETFEKAIALLSESTKSR